MADDQQQRRFGVESGSGIGLDRYGLVDGWPAEETPPQPAAGPRKKASHTYIEIPLHVRLTLDEHDRAKLEAAADALAGMSDHLRTLVRVLAEVEPT